MDNKSVVRCQRRKKLRAIEAFGGKCQICGYNKCPNALEFHHVNDDKEQSPSYVIMRWSWNKLIEELKKCILVCANCHREIHYKYLDVDLKSYVLDWIDKKCLVCNEEFKTKNSNQKHCSSKCSKFSTRKVKRPSKEELKKLIEENSFVALGRMFGVSDNAVRKWAKGFGLL